VLEARQAYERKRTYVIAHLLRRRRELVAEIDEQLRRLGHDPEAGAGSRSSRRPNPAPGAVRGNARTVARWGTRRDPARRRRSRPRLGRAGRASSSRPGEREATVTSGGYETTPELERELRRHGTDSLEGGRFRAMVASAGAGYFESWTDAAPFVYGRTSKTLQGVLDSLEERVCEEASTTRRDTAGAS